MESIEILPTSLRGIVKPPPSKSLSHRGIIASSLCNGQSSIENIVLSQDVLHTCEGLKTLGIDMDYLREDNEDIYSLRIRGNPRLSSRGNTIDCGQSASTLRFLIPLAAMTGEEISFRGRGSLVSRPLGPYYRIFEDQNIFYETINGGLPLRIKGTLKPGTFKLPGDISSQFITGLLFALPLLQGDSKINIIGNLESRGYIDLTIDVLKEFGIEVENKDYREFFIRGKQVYKPNNYMVEGDFSQGAFWMVAGLLGGEIETTNLDTNSLQADKIIIDIIKKMGGHISIGEEGIVTKASSTRGIRIDGSQCPDLVPILAVLASVSQGTTNIVNVKRLRLKESDRLQAMASQLNILGARVTELEEELIIEGVNTLRGGLVDSYNDHRIAMALSIASIKSNQAITIRNWNVVDKSYPGFWQDFIKLGGRINGGNMG